MLQVIINAAYVIVSCVLIVFICKDVKSRDAHTDAILTYSEAVREQNSLLRNLLNRTRKEV